MDWMGLYMSPEEEAKAKGMALAQALARQKGIGNVGLLSGDKVLSQFGAAQLQDAQKQGGQLSEAGQTRYQGGLQQALAKMRLAQEMAQERARNSEWDRRNEITSAQEMDRARILAGQKAAEKADSDEQKRGEKLEKGVGELSKAMEGASGMRTDIGTLVNAAQQEDVPGVGPLDQLVPTKLAKDDAVKTEQAALRVLAAILKQQSGISVNEAELKRAMKARGLSGDDERAFRLGVESMLGDLRQGMGQKQIAQPAEVVEEYRRRGGVTVEDLPTYSPSGAGTPTATAPHVKTAADYAALPTGAEYLDPNGKLKRKK